MMALRGLAVSSQVVLSATVAEMFEESEHTTAFAAVCMFRELSNALFYLAGPFFGIQAKSAFVAVAACVGAVAMVLAARDRGRRPVAGASVSG